jgi:hypothetical protein
VLSPSPTSFHRGSREQEGTAVWGKGSYLRPCVGFAVQNLRARSTEQTVQIPAGKTEDVQIVQEATIPAAKAAKAWQRLGQRLVLPLFSPWRDWEESFFRLLRAPAMIWLSWVSLW